LFGVDSQNHRLRARVVDICAGLPEVAVDDGRHIGFSVRGKRFAWFLDDHHGDGRLALTCKAPPGENTALAERHAGRFFLPSYVASRGWVGLRLDAGPVDWDEVERLAVDAYLLTAPKRLGASVRSQSPGSP
jgi:hypothetical protein